MDAGPGCHLGDSIIFMKEWGCYGYDGQGDLRKPLTGTPVQGCKKYIECNERSIHCLTAFLIR